MPELPEVETTVRALRPLLVGQTFGEVRNYWPRHIDRPDLSTLQQRLHGRSVHDIGRRGKYILIHLNDGQVLIIHLRMTGHLSVVNAEVPRDNHTHTIFSLNDGQELRFRDTRKFGRVYLVDEADEIVGSLGPEPLAADFTVDVLRQRLHGRRRVLKPLLLDQQFLAGIGNIYADEALFYARLRPTRRSETLSEAEIAALHKGIRRALALGVEREGASITNYIKPDGQKGDMQNAVNVFRRTEQPCYRCGEPIERIVLGQRSTHFCPVCQR